MAARRDVQYGTLWACDVQFDGMDETYWVASHADTHRYLQSTRLHRGRQVKRCVFEVIFDDLLCPVVLDIEIDWPLHVEVPPCTGAVPAILDRAGLMLDDWCLLADGLLTEHEVAVGF